MDRNPEQFEELLESTTGDEFDFKEILHKYLRRWHWFVLSVLIMLLIGYVVVKMQVPKYKIDTAILIKDKEQSNDKDILQQLNLYSSDKIIDNEVQILKTSMLMEKVVQSLELENTYIIENHLSDHILYNRYVPFKLKLIQPNATVGSKKWIVKYINENQIQFDGKTIPFDHPVSTSAGMLIVLHQKVANPRKDPIQVIFGTVEGSAQYYLNKLVITPASKQSTVLFISMEDDVPERGVDILTKLVDEYNQMSVDDKNITTANTLKFIESRLSVVATELDNVEKSVEKYKANNKILDISAQSNIFLSNVQLNDAQISKIDLEFGVLKNLENYLKNQNPRSDKIPAMQGIDDPTLLALVAQLAAIQIDKEHRLRTIPETNPVVGSINDQISALRKTILQTVENVKSGLENNKRQLQSQSAKYENTIKDVPSKERGLIDVMRDRDIKNNLFTFLLQKREETQITLASTVSDSKTIDRAKSSGMYFKPAKNVIYSAFLIIGLLIPFLIIYIAGVLDSTIRKKRDIERITKTPILSQINYSTELNTMVTINNPRSMISEQIRSMRTNLQFILPEEGHKNILFTSSVSGEGKSFISLNLGASIASTGKKVVVLELDLRKPRFFESLGYKNKSGFDTEIGLSNFLIGKYELKDILRTHPDQQNLDIILSGIVPPNPAELLLNGRIEALLEELKKKYDYIIMDAPPIGLLTDAQILARYADTTLFVVRYNYTLKENIKVLEEFRAKRIFKNLNVIFNSVDISQTGYGYGYGYYEDNNAKRTFVQKITNRS